MFFRLENGKKLRHVKREGVIFFQLMGWLGVRLGVGSCWNGLCHGLSYLHGASMTT